MSLDAHRDGVDADEGDGRDGCEHPDRMGNTCDAPQPTGNQAASPARRTPMETITNALTVAAMGLGGSLGLLALAAGAARAVGRRRERLR